MRWPKWPSHGKLAVRLYWMLREEVDYGGSYSRVPMQDSPSHLVVVVETVRLSIILPP